MLSLLPTYALKIKPEVPTRVFGGCYYQRGERRYIAPPTRDCQVFRTRIKENNIFPEMFYIISISARATLLYSCSSILPLVTLRFRKYSGRLHAGRMDLVTKSNSPKFRTTLLLLILSLPS